MLPLGKKLPFSNEFLPNNKVDGGFSIRAIPSSPEYYRCPVSTPADNFQRRTSLIPRARRVDDIKHFLQPSSIVNRSVNKDSKRPGQPSKKPMNFRSSMGYYYVGANDKTNGQVSNRNWVQGLCAQPVDEIINKYRRKYDVNIRRIAWSKTSSTPGERSLLNAWNKTQSKDHERLSQTKTKTKEGACNKAEHIRQTKSEPPSRADISKVRFLDQSNQVWSNDLDNRRTNSSKKARSYLPNVPFNKTKKNLNVTTIQSEIPSHGYLPEIDTKNVTSGSPIDSNLSDSIYTPKLTPLVPETTPVPPHEFDNFSLDSQRNVFTE